MTFLNMPNDFKDASKLVGLDAKIYAAELEFQKLNWYGTVIEFAKIVEENHPDMKDDNKKLLLLEYLDVYLHHKKNNPNEGDMRLAVEVQKRISEARTDELTGLPNTRAFNERLGQEAYRLQHVAVDHPKRASDGAVMIMIDLDGFKPINDTYGHNAGDAALKVVAQTLRNTLEEHFENEGLYLPARIGGDEFVVLMSTNDMAQAEQIVKKLQEAFENLRFRYNDNDIRIGASIGFSKVDPSKTPEEIKEDADKEMYRIKEAKGDTRHKVIATGTSAQADPPTVRKV
jgi:diguanylate cyclase (GGDEF)-like protein